MEPNEVQVETLLNRETGELPFAYFDPKMEGKLVWKCNYDAEGKITSVVSFTGPEGEKRNCKYLESKEEADAIKEDVIKSGWLKLKPPQITLTYPGQKEGVPLNRKQRRLLQKKIKRLQKKNPFNKE